MTTGSTTFDLKEASFGIFTSSETHIAYSEDSINKALEPKHIAHAVRSYPVRDRKGALIENTYLVCFEEARNGGYFNVFLLSNVVPVED